MLNIKHFLKKGSGRPHVSAYMWSSLYPRRFWLLFQTSKQDYVTFAQQQSFQYMLQQSNSGTGREGLTVLMANDRQELIVKSCPITSACTFHAGLDHNKD